MEQQSRRQSYSHSSRLLIIAMKIGSMETYTTKLINKGENLQRKHKKMLLSYPVFRGTKTSRLFAPPLSISRNSMCQDNPSLNFLL
jgi:hypothetical protein